MHQERMKIKSILAFLFLSVVNMLSVNTRFYNINDIYGTSVREVYSICKDDDGFIWSGAKTGVIRISDSDSRIYSLPFQTTDHFFTRVIYGDSQLVAYTSSGQIFLYDAVYDRFDPYLDLRQKLNDNYIATNGVIIDQKKVIWIGTAVGLYLYKDADLQLATSKEMEIQQIADYKNYYLFIATQKGIALFNKNTFKTEYLYQYTGNNSLQVSSFLYDEETDMLWIGTDLDGLFSFDLKEEQLTQIPINNFPRQPVLALKKNANSTLLVGIDGQGVWELSEDGKKLLNVYKEDVNDPFSLWGDGVYDLFCDQNERVWVATYTGGLSFFDQKPVSVNQIAHQINNSNSLINNHVNKVIEDRRGNIWFATNNGISRWNIATNQWNSYFHNKADQAKVFLTICEDVDGNIWTGTYSSGFYVLDGNTGKVLNHLFSGDDINVLSEKFVTDIYKDSQGNMWIGGPSYVSCYNRQKKSFIHYTPQSICSFKELSPGKMLLACSHGLLALEVNTGEVEILLDNYLVREACIVDDYIWLATSGEGLIQYDYKNRVFRKHTTKSGLISNYVNSIIYMDGILWLGTENGLCQFEVRNNCIHRFSASSPLSTTSFNVNSCWLLRNNNLIWGTNKGALMFNPGLLYQNEAKGRIFFQDIQVSGQSIRDNNKLLKNTAVNAQTHLKLKLT